MLTGDNLLSELLDQRRVRIYGERVEGTDDVVCARAISEDGNVTVLDTLVLIVIPGDGAAPEEESGFEAPVKVWSVAPGTEVMMPKIEVGKLADLLPTGEIGEADAALAEDAVGEPSADTPVEAQPAPVQPSRW